MESNNSGISKAVVTGGAGFIGSHIVDELIGRGIETIVVDDFTTGSMENLAKHKEEPLLHVMRGNEKDIGRLLHGVSKVDVVFHEAAIASVPKSVEDPLFVHDVNVNYTLDVLDYCLKQKVKRLIFASSAAVYGLIKEPPAKEDMHCMPASPYGASKLAVEDYLSAYYRTYGLETVILRYFNVFGPRQKSSSYSGVITIFINALLSGKIPTIFGDGMQTRDFVHVRDIASANMLAMYSDRAAGGVFNVASGSAVSISRLFEIIREATGSREDLRPIFGNPTPGDVRIGTASIEKIQATLGYAPKVSLERGLSELIEQISVTRNKKREESMITAE